MKMQKRKILLPLLTVAVMGSTALYARHNSDEQSMQSSQMHKKQRKHKKHRNKKARYAGWYMRTRVFATAADGTVYSHESAGVFGKLRQSKNKKDRHDIPAFSAATLQVVFPHYDWKEGDAGDYWSDYRRYRKRRSHRRTVWTFQVKNQKKVDLSNADLKIVLDDAIKVNYVKENGSIRYIESDTDKEMKSKFTLIDVDNNQTYQVDELPYANLSMDGKHTRTFRWVKGRVKKRDFRPVKMPE